MPQGQNLGGDFVSFFLGGQNRNFLKLRGPKLLLRQKKRVTAFVVWCETKIHSLKSRFKSQNSGCCIFTHPHRFKSIVESKNTRIIVKSHRNRIKFWNPYKIVGFYNILMDYEKNLHRSIFTWFVNWSGLYIDTVL